MYIKGLEVYTKTLDHQGPNNGEELSYTLNGALRLTQSNGRIRIDFFDLDAWNPENCVCGFWLDDYQKGHPHRATWGVSAHANHCKGRAFFYPEEEFWHQTEIKMVFNNDSDFRAFREFTGLRSAGRKLDNIPSMSPKPKP